MSSLKRLKDVKDKAVDFLRMTKFSITATAATRTAYTLATALTPLEYSESVADGLTGISLTLGATADARNFFQNPGRYKSKY